MAIEPLEEKMKIPLSDSVRIKNFLSTERVNAAQKALQLVTTSRELFYFCRLHRFLCCCAWRVATRKMTKNESLKGFFGLHIASARPPDLGWYMVCWVPVSLPTPGLCSALEMTCWVWLTRQVAHCMGDAEALLKLCPAEGEMAWAQIGAGARNLVFRVFCKRCHQ